MRNERIGQGRGVKQTSNCAPSPVPAPRGPLSASLLAHLATAPHDIGTAPSLGAGVDPRIDDDLQLALHCAYELHYRGLAGVDDGWEWEPSLVGWVRALERAFIDAVVQEVDVDVSIRPAEVPDALWTMATSGGGPSLSGFVEAEATLEQVRELAVHRSAYQLKEADPHTWGIPRLSGGPKAAMVRIQADEYGGGQASAMHAALFALTMSTLGLSNGYGVHVDLVPGYTLATGNLITMFGLHRRWRGALVGHLALFEMTSVGPMGRYASALDRLGVHPAGRRFYDVHVVADAEHQFVGAVDLAGGLARDDPALVPSILFGAAALTAVEARFTRRVLDAWSAGRTSLLAPLQPLVPVHPARALAG